MDCALNDLNSNHFHALYRASWEGGGLPPLKSVLAFLIPFGEGFPPLGLSESNSTRREQNFPPGQIEIGDFLNFWCFEASLMSLDIVFLKRLLS